MSAEVVNLRDRLKRKWLERESRQQEKARNREYESCGKGSVLCKCPRCEVEHYTFIRWSGRGMPRVYCGTCRSLVANYPDSAVGVIVGMTGKSSRKGTYQGYE